MRGLETQFESGCSRWQIILISILRLMALFALLPALVGCAQPLLLPKLKTPTEDRSYWAGRMALQLEEQASQSFSAYFELDGNPAKGQLKLLSPFGNTLAKINWEPGQAQLNTGNEIHASSSLEELLLQATGIPISVATLFDWLAGLPTAAVGWEADLSGLVQGKIVAVRQNPKPQATLRITFEQ